MKHILDNPIWLGLTTDNASFASGTHAVKYFPSPVAPFAAFEEESPEHYQTLYDLIDEDRGMVVFSPRASLEVAPWRLINSNPGFQLVFEGALNSPAKTEYTLVDLTERDVPAMLELTQLVPPGPFFKGTIAFGGYRGIFADDKLVAMAGQRLKGGGFTEISAVCTHSDFGGRGFARQLVADQIEAIIAAGNRPYLHVRADNHLAKDLYERMGFVVRSEMNFYYIKKS